MEFRIADRGVYWGVLLAVAVFVGLYLTSLYSYPLFHSLVETFSLVIGCGLFLVAWNVRQFLKNNYLLFIGVAYLFVAGLDLVHMLAYKGMGVFPGIDANLPTQLWIAARYMESISLVLAPLFIERRPRVHVLFAVFSGVFTLLLISVFYRGIFPDCYVEGSGLTAFKIVSEYVICLILLCALALLFVHRKKFDPRVLRLVVASIILTIGSELAFTLYISVYGLANLIGHYLKVISFYLMYRAIIQTGLREPYDLLFRELQGEKEALSQSEEALRQAKEELQAIIEASPVSIIALDRDGAVKMWNPASEHIFGWTAAETIGKSLPYVSEERTEEHRAFRERALRGEKLTGVEVQRKRKDGSSVDISFSTAPLRNSEGRTDGLMAVNVNITARKRAEDEKSVAILELEKALAQVKKLSGFLPICASCKKIRDDKGYWQQIESYITEHSEALFSHSVCPDCAKQLYPEFYGDR